MARGYARPILIYVAAFAVLVWVAFPLLWLLKSSFSPEIEMLSIPPDLIPRHPTPDYYLPAAYAIARYRFPLRHWVLNSLLSSRMVPSLILLVPFYLLFRAVGLIDSLVAVVIAHISVSLPFTVWILRGHFMTVPIEIEKAARVDGCGRLQTFRYVALPLAAPGLVVAGLFAFMLSWNEFPLALILSVSPDSLPVQPALAGLSSYQGVSYGFLFAGSILAALPPLLVALVLQRHLTQGILEGSVK